MRFTKITFFLSEGIMLSDKKGQVAKEFRKSRALCSCSYKTDRNAILKNDLKINFE